MEAPDADPSTRAVGDVVADGVVSNHRSGADHGQMPPPWMPLPPPMVNPSRRVTGPALVMFTTTLFVVPHRTESWLVQLRSVADCLRAGEAAVQREIRFQRHMPGVGAPRHPDFVAARGRSNGRRHSELRIGPTRSGQGIIAVRADEIDGCLGGGDRKR